MAKPVMQFFLAIFLLLAWSQVNAGKYPDPDLIFKISKDTIDILIKHGMPVRHDRENPWYKNSAIPNLYIIFLYQEDDIPLQAKVDIIHYCMTLYEKRGRKDEFKILMYREKFEPRLFKPKPSFELKLRRID